MATIDVTTSRNLTAVTYAQDDIINVLDGVTLTINSQWSIRPRTIQALGTGRIEVSNTSTTTPHVQEFYMQNGSNAGGISVQQNGVFQVRGGWITVGTSTGANNQVLFTCNNIGGVAIDYPTMIQVETGSGTNVWEVWQAIPIDVVGGTINTLGFNAPNITDGNVSITAAGVVTGTGTNFSSAMTGLNFKLPGIARDFVVGTYTSATQITIQELDGTTYTGGVIAAGSAYILRSGSLVNTVQLGNNDIGKVLAFNPLTGQVSMGDGTNGTKIPTGARVRVPNIHFNSALQQTTLTTAITSTAAQNLTLAAAIGTTANNGYATTSHLGTLLLVSGSTCERIYYATRSGTTVSSTSMIRGVAGTTAQASFPIGTLVYWIPSGVYTTNNASFSCNPSGTMDIQICSVGLRMQAVFVNYADLTIKNFGCGSIITVSSSAGTYNLDSISVIGGNYQTPLVQVISASFVSLIGSGSIKNIYVHSNIALVGNTSGMSLSNVQNAQAISNLRVRMWNRNTTLANSNYFRCILFSTVKCATPVDGLYMAGGGLGTLALTNIDIKNINVSSLPNGNSAGTTDSAVYALYIASTVNSTFRGIQTWSGGLPNRASLINIQPDCESVVCHNKGYSAINGATQLSSILLDAGLNTIVAWISITNPRTSASASFLAGNVTTNSGGALRMLLIDSITSTATNTGATAKGGAQLDMVAGPHRYWSSTTTTSVVPNLVDVQPIVVLSNTAKTVGSVYVGGFSAQNAFDMYTFAGGAYLDNLGRIYYPAIGDSVIIKSVFALKGITNFTGTAFDFNYNLGSGTNPIPTGTTVEFRMTNWGTANTGAWTAFTSNANLETARAALTGYSSSVGIDLQFRITGTTAVAGRYVMSLKMPVTIDASYNPSVYSTDIGFTGAQAGTLIAGYLNANPSSPVLQSSLTLTGSSGSVPTPYDYDAVPVAYRLVARKAGWTFSSLTGTYTKTAISIPITQNQVVDVNGNPLYISGVTGVAVDHVAQTITVSANRSAVEIWSAVQDNLCLLANLTVADPFTTTNGTVFDSSYTLVVTGGITSGNIDSNVTLSGTLANGVIIVGNVAQATPTNLTGVSISGNLTYNTASSPTIILTNTNISGTVSNSGAGTVTISRSNSTIGTVGTRVITRPVTALTLNGLTAGSQVYVANGSGTQVAYVASSSTSYTLDTTGQTGTWTWKVARYGFTAQTGTHRPAVESTTTTVTLSADSFVTQATKATVAAYEFLPNMDKLYDYAAYYETTNAGIPYARIITKAGTNASAGSYPVEINDVGDVWIFNGTSLSIYVGTSLVAGTTITGALFSSNNVTIPSNLVNTAITANVVQDVPSDLSGMVITGNLTYNESRPFAFTATITDSTITGTISNIGFADVKVIKAGTSPFFTAGTRVTVVGIATFRTSDNLALSTYVVKNGSVDLGWVVQDTARTVEVSAGDTFAVYAVAYGYQRKLYYPVASDFGTFTTSLIPETNVDTSLSTTNRNYIATQITTALVGQEVAVSVGADLRSYSPADVLNGLHYYTVVYGALPAYVSILSGTTEGFGIIQGGISITSPAFYAKVNDSITATTDLGVLIPLYFQVASSVYGINPAYTPVKKNSSGVILQTAPWTQQTAVISETDKAGIRSGLALETTVATKASQTSVDAIPTEISAADKADIAAASVSATWSHPVDAGYSAEQVLKLVGAVLVGKVSGSGSGTETFIGLDDSTVRIVAVVDGSGNRTGINRNAT